MRINKTLIVFVIAGILWCLGLALFLCKPKEKVVPDLISQNLLADTLLLQENSDLVVPTPSFAPVKILAFGDMMLDRSVRAQINKNGPEYPFALIKDFLKGNDIVVANAEGPFTNNKSVTLGVKDGPLVFTFDPAILPTLKKLGFTLLSQANNHTLNFGMAGFRQSASTIEKAGLNWFGDPRNKEIKPYITEIRGEKVAFIGYHEFAYQGMNDILQAIVDAKNVATFVVVYPHWGEEYRTTFTVAQQKVAHTFIDAGADVVLGAHPHVIEPIEIYKNKLIFYSLGNFIFDQAANAPTGRGLAVRISLEPSFATYSLFPFSIVKQQAALMPLAEKQKELDRLNMQNGIITVTR